ncbi:signal transduction histidine kinase [Polymorphobacter glacialis]|uniref:histidine kinase n=1 Tax=Sandarakinorhabdus glacialis TaxID=1614636 RepID=A0A916ZU11_9SPHN|nr:HWE histidine kinase domain-containing protein [Polymorphobacter glacialis]GGE14165.1 signal transduction histidine kinase [Polymorphobacter glacialis]
MTEAATTDLLDCASEPIHVPGTVQSYGFLLALTLDWAITRVSANVAAFTGLPPAAWLGSIAADLIAPQALHTLRNQAAYLRETDEIHRLFAIELIAGRPPFDIAMHRSGDAIVIEAEPAMLDEREAAALVRAMLARLKHSEALPAFLRDGARHIQALTGFARVMVYRFDADGHGEVVAEALRGAGTGTPYLGLHYPAGDIPAQARALYLRSAFRIIADVASDPVPIDSLPSAASEKLDQSLSVLRAVSPVHIEYLRNMGVAASMSISIVVDGKLWGLFACHHTAPRLPSFAYRTGAELFGEMFSMMLESRLRRDAAEDEARADAAARLLVAEMEHDRGLLTNARRLGELIFDIIPAAGLAVRVDGKIWSTGAVPNPAQCSAITSWLAAETHHRMFSSAALSTVFPPAADHADTAVGLVAIPLMRGPEDYLLLFRPEQATTILWAGDPDKSDGPGTNGRLAPRQSFNAWAELVTGRSLSFTPGELVAAETIRVALLEGLYRSRGLLSPDVQLRSGQELLIAELNHRVRNILALIRGVISQTRTSAEDAEGFIETLGKRVQSLARAHDQITSDRWGPARLKDLISTESDAYLGPRRDRVRLSGPNVLVRPAAFTALALVFHELMTNAAKYGALSNGGVSEDALSDDALSEDGAEAGGGTVTVAWRFDSAGDLLIDWSESGGPEVVPPTRRGFGSAIIERSVPYDLGGSAALQYLPTGFVANFCIPGRHLAGLSSTDVAAETVFVDDRNPALLAGLHVLLVEDTMIIAMDCADMLRGFGASEVVTAATARAALEAIESDSFAFALLDYNLGKETSIAVADALAAHGIPFAFATGYDGDPGGLGHPDVPVIGKPYGRQQIAQILTRLGFAKTA